MIGFEVHVIGSITENIMFIGMAGSVLHVWKMGFKELLIKLFIERIFKKEYLPKNLSH